MVVSVSESYPPSGPDNPVQLQLRGEDGLRHPLLMAMGEEEIGDSGKLEPGNN